MLTPRLGEATAAAAAAVESPAGEQAQEHQKQQQTNKYREQDQQGRVGYMLVIEHILRQQQDAVLHARDHNVKHVVEAVESRLGADYLIQSAQVELDRLAIIAALDLGGAVVRPEVAQLQLSNPQLTRLVCLFDRINLIENVLVVLVAQALLDRFLPEAPVDIGLRVAVNVADKQRVIAKLVQRLVHVLVKLEFNIAHERVRVDVQKVRFGL